MVIDERSGTQVRLRRKNQLTVPDAVLTEVGATVGDHFIVSVQDGTIRMERILPSYAGTLADAYPPDWAERLRRDRDTWRG